MGIIDSNLNKIRALCDKYHVSKLFVFGSVSTNSDTPNSDIDFIVTFHTINLYDYADNYFALKNALENIFQRPVDLLEDKAIRNPFLRKSIDSTKKMVYGY